MFQAKGPSQSTWLSHIDSKVNHILNKEYSTVSTQTYGLYYASSKSLETKHEKDEKYIRMEREFLEKRPPLTAISAGKGKLFKEKLIFFSPTYSKQKML